jgi:hypothetical protein
MYVEFRLPTGAGGMAAGHCAALIKRNIEAWAVNHNIKYRTKIVNYTLRLSLLSEQDYTLFQLSWNPDHHCAREYTLVEPMAQKN